MVGQVTSVKHYIETLPERFQANASKGLHAVFQFELSGDEGSTFHVSVDDGTMKVVDGVMAAQRSLQTVLAIRDKAVSAYQEVARMAI